MKLKGKILAAALACVITVGFIPTNASAAVDASPSVNTDVSAHATLDGDGSESNPYKIKDAAGFKEFAAIVNDGELAACAELTADIDLNPGITFHEDGSYEGGTPEQWTTIADYSGTFNGNGKTIRGLYINNDSTYQGIFGESTGTIKNLGVIESYVSAKSYVGSIVGRNGKGTVINCYNEGFVKGETTVGGVSGYTYGAMQDCYNTGSVTGSGNTIGGVTGHSAQSLKNCYNTGTIVGGADTVGGVTGSAYGIVENCYNTGAVTGTGNYSWEANVGGVVGSCGSYSRAGTVQNCYNTGNVTGNNAFTGGISGDSSKRTEIINCYNTGSIVSEAAYSGGITGELNNGTVQFCHNTGSVQGALGKGAVAGCLRFDYTMENTYYLSDAETEDGGRTKAQFASGEVAWQLNENQSAQVWKQNIDNGEEKGQHPVFSGGDVYQVNKYSTCDKSDEPVNAYSNTNADILGTHNEVQHVDEKAATSTENGNIEYWYCADCGKYFADEALTEEISREQTVVPAVNPSDYSFEVKYVDGEGNPVPGGGTITFDKTGSYSREDIPLPYGYMQMTPAHPDEDWLYPTALEFVDGQWVVTNPVVEIMVEPMAKVDIIFKTPDGKVLEDFGYTKYYDSEGGGIETVTAPEGYEFVGEGTYAVYVTRDADGKLVADPTEVEFVVKAVGGGEPTEPEEPSKPTEPEKPTDPSKPGESTDSPQTGDSSNLNLCVAIMVVSAGAIFIVLMANRRRKATEKN